MLVHQLQQQRPHDVSVVLQFAVQRHRQQRGEITTRASVEVRTTLQCVDELEPENTEARFDNKTERQRIDGAGGQTHIDEKGFTVQQVGELVERLSHDGPAGLWDLDFSREHGIVNTILGGQEEVSVGVVFVVQEGDPGLAQVAGVVLHFNHQV